MSIANDGRQYIAWTLQDIAAIVGGDWRSNSYGDNEGDADVALDAVVVNGVCTDSRQLEPGQLYIALRGARFDGDNFVSQARGKGAIAAIVHEYQDCDLPQLRVKDTRQALAALAHEHRQRCAVKVLALTGSNGKTTTKELLKRLLATQGRVLATQGNLNNDIGVPLTLLRLQGNERFAVIEMGANHPGEITRLTEIAQPDSVLITNVGAAHLEGFGSLEGVIAAKGEIYAASRCAQIIMNKDLVCARAWQEKYPDRIARTFALDASADVYAQDITADGRSFMLYHNDQRAKVKWQMVGRHNVYNALAAFAAASIYGVTVADAAQAWLDLALQQGRLSCHQVAGHAVYDDTYNANVASFKAGIDVVAQSSPSLVIAGAMGELGEQSATLHQEVSDYARKRAIGQFWCVGIAAQQYGTEDDFIRYFADHSAAASALRAWLTRCDGGGVLVKGSRSAQMERVLALAGIID